MVNQLAIGVIGFWYSVYNDLSPSNREAANAKVTVDHIGEM